MPDFRLVSACQLAVAIVTAAAGALPLAAQADDMSAAAPPETLVGIFQDDYDSRADISAERWLHGSDTLRIVAWEPSARRLFARDGESAEAPWVRIDWVELDGTNGWDWAWCMAVWNAATRADARTAPEADRSTPRSGCNGHPFTRMRRATSR